MQILRVHDAGYPNNGINDRRLKCRDPASGKICTHARFSHYLSIPMQGPERAK
jgi:hypothetical protein